MEIELKQKIEEEIDINNFEGRIKSHPVLNYFYDPSPKRTIINICSYSLQSDTRVDFAREKAIKIFQGMKFKTLYPKRDSNWEEIFESMLLQMQNSFKPVDGGERILSFIVKKDVEKVPTPLWIIPSKNQKIKIEEFEFVLKTLNFKILKNWHTKRKDHYMLPQNWFLNEDAKKKYYEKTKRRVNRHKISRITELLFEYKLIVKYQPWDKKTNKIRPIVYKLGDENFYKRRIILV